MTITKPMLAATAKDLDKLRYPLLASPKVDGIRCVKVGGKALTRKFKPLPNRHVREWIERNIPDGADGELIVMVGDIEKGYGPGTFNECQSAFMSMQGIPRFEYLLFDFIPDSDHLEKPFAARINKLASMPLFTKAKVLEHVILRNEQEVLDYEKKVLDLGYEGVMLRDPSGPYKQGRSTLNQGWLLKLKRWEDAEAEVLEVIERQHNTNEQVRDELGYAKRSSAKAGKVGMDTLGKFHVRDLESGKEFDVGTGEGMTDSLRDLLWSQRDALVGTVITYKYLPYGSKDRPRFPIWKGFRDARDMGEPEKQGAYEPPEAWF